MRDFDIVVKKSLFSSFGFLPCRRNVVLAFSSRVSHYANILASMTFFDEVIYRERLNTFTLLYKNNSRRRSKFQQWPRRAKKKPKCGCKSSMAECESWIFDTFAGPEIRIRICQIIPRTPEIVRISSGPHSTFSHANPTPRPPTVSGTGVPSLRTGKPQLALPGRPWPPRSSCRPRHPTFCHLELSTPRACTLGKIRSFCLGISCQLSVQAFPRNSCLPLSHRVSEICVVFSGHGVFSTCFQLLAVLSLRHSLLLFGCHRVRHGPEVVGGGFDPFVPRNFDFAGVFEWKSEKSRGVDRCQTCSHNRGMYACTRVRDCRFSISNSSGIDDPRVRVRDVSEQNSNPEVPNFGPAGRSYIVKKIGGGPHKRFRSKRTPGRPPLISHFMQSKN